MEDIKKIRVVSSTGITEHEIEDSEARDGIIANYQDIVELQDDIIEIKKNAAQYDTLGVNVFPNAAEIYIRSIDTEPRTFPFPAATPNKAGVMTAEDKVKLDNLATIGTSVDLNEYTNEGVYYIHIKDEAYNYPVLTPKNSVARLTVVGSYDGNNTVITQVLNLNNNAGGEGNIYIRAKQGDTWGAWGKMQTNIEVNAIGLGQSKTFDDLTDNGIYSGVNVYAVGYDDNGYPITAYETFVLVVINAYLTGGGVAQLKYSTLLDGTTTVKLRSKVNGVWGEWRGLGGGGDYTLPVATTNVLGGVKSYAREGISYSDPNGAQFGVVVEPSGHAHIQVPYASTTTEGLLEVEDKKLLNEVRNNSYVTTEPIGEEVEDITSREVKDLIDGRIGEKFYPKSHAKAVYMSDGRTVEDAIEQPIIEQTETSVEIAPNVLNVWGEVVELDITLAEGKAGVVNEYMFQFTSGETATTLVLPAEIKWVSAPSVRSNKTYQVSIINNLAVIGEFSNE